MRQAFDALAAGGETRQEHLARLVMKVAREQGASTPSALVERVQQMISAPAPKEFA